MKKTFLLSVIAIVASLTVSAQIKKGALLIGGQLSFTGSNSQFINTQRDVKYRSGFYNVAAGLTVKENKAIGVYASYGNFNYDYTNNTNGTVYLNSRGDNYKFGVFYRQYKKLAKDFYLFGQLNTGYTGGKQTDTDLPSNNKTSFTRSGGELYLTPGISYRLYKKLHVELSIPELAGVSYFRESRTSAATPSSDYKQNSFRFNTSLNTTFLDNLGLGFRFIL